MMVTHIVISDYDLDGDGCLRERAHKVPESSHYSVPLPVARLAARIGDVAKHDECVGAQLAECGYEYGAHERLTAHAVYPDCVRPCQVKIGHHHYTQGCGRSRGESAAGGLHQEVVPQQKGCRETQEEREQRSEG